MKNTIKFFMALTLMVIIGGGVMFGLLVFSMFGPN